VRVCGVGVSVYEQMLQLYPDESCEIGGCVLCGGQGVLFYLPVG
jgi:hypothetical protein